MKQIAVAVKNTVNNITITVSKATASGPSLADKAFGYLQIDTVNITDADISSATIDFQVDKSWLDANKIDKSKVVLNRLSNNTWAALETKQISEEASYAFYRAESPGLSVFAITGKELPAAAPSPSATQTPKQLPIEISKVVKDYGIWILVFGIAAIVLGYLYYHHEHAKKTFGKYSFKK